MALLYLKNQPAFFYTSPFSFVFLAKVPFQGNVPANVTFVRKLATLLCRAQFHPIRFRTKDSFKHPRVYILLDSVSYNQMTSRRFSIEDFHSDKTQRMVICVAK